MKVYAADRVTITMNLVPLRSAIGMMEQWNDGIMGFGKMEKWITGKIPLHMGVKEVNMKISFLIKPTFQYSIIPCAKQKIRPQKRSFILNRLHKSPEVI